MFNTITSHSYWYKNGCLYPDMGTVFIAIDKCNMENGCLKVCGIDLIYMLYIVLLASPFTREEGAGPRDYE